MNVRTMIKTIVIQMQNVRTMMVDLLVNVTPDGKAMEGCVQVIPVEESISQPAGKDKVWQWKCGSVEVWRWKCGSAEVEGRKYDYSDL